MQVYNAGQRERKQLPDYNRKSTLGLLIGTAFILSDIQEIQELYGLLLLSISHQSIIRRILIRILLIRMIIIAY